MGCKAVPLIPQPLSKLERHDQPALVEVALQELMGRGNGLKKEKVGKSKEEVDAPYTALTYDDQTFLIRKVFLPVLADEENLEKLKAARCEGGQECKGAFSPDEAYTHPAVKLALTQILIEGHPRAQTLWEDMLVHVVETVGGAPHAICYRSKRRPEPVLAVDVDCPELWKESAWDGYRRVFSAKAYFFDTVPMDKRSPAALEQTKAYLNELAKTKGREGYARKLLDELREATKDRLVGGDETMDQQEEEPPPPPKKKKKPKKRRR
ncbi:MAG: hypothetical protein ACOZIN_05925 [Myxococcota bacterium]